MCVCVSDPRAETVQQQQQQDSPVRVVGRMIMQQSYICALIAMMVTYSSSLMC